MLSLQSKGIKGAEDGVPFWKRLAQEEEEAAAAAAAEAAAEAAASSSAAPVTREGRLATGPLADRARAFLTSNSSGSGTSAPAPAAAAPEVPRRPSVTRITFNPVKPDAPAASAAANTPVVNPNPSGVAAARALFAAKARAGTKVPLLPGALGSTGFLPAAKMLKPTLHKPPGGGDVGAEATEEYEEDAPRLVLDDPENCPLLYIEVGTYETRFGVWSTEDARFELRFTCPSYVAVARNDRNRHDLVGGVGRNSDAMYETFRETGVFVGNDAKYVLYDHPDTGLRGGLSQQPVLVDGRIGHRMGFLMLLHHCVFRGLGLQDVYHKEVQVVFAAKMSFSRADLSFVAECLFERLGCAKACFYSEASLAADAHQALHSPLKDLDGFPDEAKPLSVELYSSVSAVVVDIGARETTVCPLYEGIIIPTAVQTCAIGGEHCTDFMELLLLATQSALHEDMFSSLLSRRKKLIARQVGTTLLHGRCAAVGSFLFNSSFDTPLSRQHPLRISSSNRSRKSTRSWSRRLRRRRRSMARSSSWWGTAPRRRRDGRRRRQRPRSRRRRLPPRRRPRRRWTPTRPTTAAARRRARSYRSPRPSPRKSRASEGSARTRYPTARN
jgi:hypothetical protein